LVGEAGVDRTLGQKEYSAFGSRVLACLMRVFSLFYLASSLGLRYFVLSDRGMVEQTVSGSVLSGSLDVAVWGIAIFVILVLLGYNLGLNKDRRYSRSFSALGALVLLCGLGIVVCLVTLGLVGMWSLVLISNLLLGLCFVFAPKLFCSARLKI
jgi:hypothetical protein